LGYKLRKSTEIHIKGYQLLQKNHTLTALDNFAISGDGDGSVIECEPYRGLVIVSSNDIAIEHMTFLNCGSIQTAQNNKNISFLAGLFFSNITNLNVSDCMVTNSTGIGIALLNVQGHVLFTHSYFVRNINNSRSGNKVKSGLAKVGGGLIIEFTYNDTENVQPSSNNNYIFYNCSFINNGGTWNSKTESEPTEASENNVIFGCGGGMAITFKGKSHGNTVRLEYCNFTNNLADWGGGYYILFEDKSYNNFVQLKSVTAESNYGVLSGGGGRFFFGPCFNRSEVVKVKPNYFQQENCLYYNNYAGWGGGVSVYGSSGFKISPPSDTNLSFFNSHWVKNRAVVASALGFLSNSIELQSWSVEYVCTGLPYTVELNNCEFSENAITNPKSQEYTRTFIVGTGTVYVDETPIIMQDVIFHFNNGTPLVLDLSNVYIYGNVRFYKNHGAEGGAVALYGRSTIILGENSSLNFTLNKASLRGGAIYSYSQGPNLKAFQADLFSRSTCFFSYINPNKHPNSWSARVTFQNNKAPNRTGQSIYCDTLQFCRRYGNITEALKWKPFEYVNSTNEPEIVTDPVEIRTSSNDWAGFPGQHISPNVLLLDERGNQTNGLLKMSLSTNSGVKLGKQVSEYIYISDGRSSVPVSFESEEKIDNFTLTLSSVYTQVIRTTVSNITTTSCFGGYKFDEKKQKCVCLPRTEMQYGYRRCNEDGETIYLKEGYWATIGRDGAFLVYPCPLDYCKCARKPKATAYTNRECVFTKFQRNSRQCAEHRKGRLCGSCDDGYSVVVGVNDCRKCDHGNLGALWLLLVILGMTVIVLAIIYFEIDFFSGPLNSWLYTYHIVHLLPSKYYYLDPFITFVISLTNGTFDVSTGECVLRGMDKIQKLALQYLMPFYCVLLLYFINKLLRCFPNLPLANRSFHNAFVTVVIISYASLIQTTVTILQPVQVDDHWYVFEQADLTFFGPHHLPYAIPALLILILIVIPFPFVIAFSSYFIRRFQRFRRFLPLFEAIQNPYRPNRSWFASYYIFCRLILITLVIFRNNYEHTLLPFLEGVCVVILLIFVLLRPYNDEKYVYFQVDACFLSLICLIICIVSAMEANVLKLNVRVFAVMARIIVYIPFIYSLVLFIRYVYRRVEIYRQGHAERDEPLM
jgi:predicted outer membrane repeat protein